MLRLIGTARLPILDSCAVSWSTRVDVKAIQLTSPKMKYGVVMDQQVSSSMVSLSRNAGRLAITSGVIGLVAFVFLIVAVTTRSTWTLSSQAYLLFRAHDLAVVLQFLLLIPIALRLHKLSRQNPPGIGRKTAAWGIGAICLVALLLLLGVCKVVNDMAYMLPQGLFGAWLILANLRLSGLLPRWLRYLGMVVGFGLVLVGTVFPGLAVFVYPSMLKIPAVSVDDEVFQNTEINHILHVLLAIGSALGVVTLPIWSLLTGAKLLSKEHAESPAIT
jgi:hypothetical protein